MAVTVIPALRRQHEGHKLTAVLSCIANQTPSCATGDPVSTNTPKVSTHQMAFHKWQTLAAPEQG